MENKIKEMVEMQNTLNIRTCGENWTSGKTNQGRTIDWQLCMMMEASELYDSLNWKHWKDIHGKDDFANARIEVVDIFHFLISECIERKGVDVTIGLLIKLLAPTKFRNRTDSIKYFINITSDEAKLSLIRYINTFNDILGNFDMSIDDLYTMYIGKNVLNQFRQDNGYKEGKYIKVWEGEEDNVHMQNFMLSSKNGADLYKKLTNKYNLIKGNI